VLVGREENLVRGIDRTIFSAFEEVSMMSESAFTAAEQLM
jgi:hypothetical protein